MRSINIQPSKRGANIDRLNPQQRSFVECLLVSRNFNASEAAKNAGYKNPSQAAHKLLKNSIVRAALGKAITERAAAAKIDAARVLEELGYIAFANPKEMFDSSGTLKNIHEMPDEIARCISGFDVETRYESNGEGEQATPVTTVKVKFWNKNQALEAIGRHLGMFQDKLKVDHGISGDTVNLLADLLARVEGRNNVIDAKVIEDKSNE